MNIRRRGWTSGLLSLGLPGLGQLSQRRFFPAVALFGVFLACLGALYSENAKAAIGTGSVSVSLWIVAFFASAEAFLHDIRRLRESESMDAARYSAYLVTAALGFVLWFGESGFGLLPHGDSMRIVNDTDAIARAIRECARIDRGSDRITVCLSGQEIPVNDPWGRAYRWTLQDGSFVVGTAGSDGAWSTEDDRIFKFRY